MKTKQYKRMMMYEIRFSKKNLSSFILRSVAKINEISSMECKSHKNLCKILSSRSPPSIFLVPNYATLTELGDIFCFIFIIWRWLRGCLLNSADEKDERLIEYNILTETRLNALLFSKVFQNRRSTPNVYVMLDKK